MRVFLETERLILRYFTEADLDNLYLLDGYPEIRQYINGGKRSDREQIRSQSLQDFSNIMMTIKAMDIGQYRKN